MTARRLTAAALLAVMVVAFIARLIPDARTIDDAFITFRYARNLVEGIGFVYNPGVPTLGTTTPLFALLMAGISGVTGMDDYPRIALGVSALADAVGCALLVVIARRAVPLGVAVLPGLLWAIAPMSVTFAIGGMETSVNILWMLAAFAVFTGERSARADIAIGVFAALGLLTRIDAALWIAPLFGWQFLSRLRARTLPWRAWIAAALVLLPWVIYATAAFGNPIPNSVTAKRDAYLIEPNSAVIRMIQTYVVPFSEFETFGPVGAMVGAVAYLLLSLTAFAYARRHAPRLIPLLAYPWLYAAAFAVLNPLIFRWYNAPPLPALMLGIVIGAWTFIRLTPPLVRPFAVGGLAALWLFTSVNGWTLMPDHGPQRPAPIMAWHALELEYQRMGTALREEFGVTPQTRVASGDIGAIGYFSRATIVDTVGLVTPELTRYYPVDRAIIAADQNYAIPPALIHDTAPDYLVTMEGFIRDGLARDSRFAAEYGLVREVPFPVYGRAMQLFARRSG